MAVHWSRLRPLRLADLLVFAAAFGVVLALVLWQGRGGFSYSLDDAYIHLAVSEEIARGGYGVNPGEFSAPSSSILWPFLLAPFAATRVQPYVPLALNLLSALGTVWIFGRLFERLGVRGAFPSPETSRLAFSFTLALSTNLIGLAFTGMEHSFQVFLTAAAILGAIEEAETGRVPWWLVAALLAGPLVRYENLAVSLPLTVYLLARRRHAAAALALVGVAGSLVGFGWFLARHGVGWIPTSVVAKSRLFAGTLSVHDLLENVVNRLEIRQGGFMACGAILLAAVAVSSSPPAERLLALAGVVMLGTNLLAGEFTWFGRYEQFAWTAMLLLLLYLHRRAIARALDRFRAPTGAWIGLGLLVCASFPYVMRTIETPMATRNIYEQDYQMHRVATEVVRGPVAVNDVGWVSYRNDQYVLDLWGLTSRDVLTQRWEFPSVRPPWLDSLVTVHRVDLVMIYESWFQDLPHSWTKIAELRLGSTKITPAEGRVGLFATRPLLAVPLRRRLAEFRSSLPRGVRLELGPSPGADPGGEETSTRL